MLFSKQVFVVLYCLAIYSDKLLATPSYLLCALLTFELKVGQDAEFGFGSRQKLFPTEREALLECFCPPPVQSSRDLCCAAAVRAGVVDQSKAGMALLNCECWSTAGCPWVPGLTPVTKPALLRCKHRALHWMLFVCRLQALVGSPSVWVCWCCRWIKGGTGKGRCVS